MRHFSRRAKVPGFRQGKVPVDVVRNRFAKEIKEDVRDRLLSRLYVEATKEKGLEPLGEPMLDDIEFGDDSALRFKTTFEVRPKFTLRNHRGIEAKEASVRVTDADVDEQLEDLRKRNAKLLTEEGRAAVTGDVVVADVAGTPDEGEPFQRDRMMIEVGEPANLPAFNDALLGVVAGSPRSFSVTYPKEFDSPRLAGRTVRYDVNVHEVKRAEIPELDDEFAKDLGDFADLAALRARVRTDLEEHKRVEAQHHVRQAILDKVLLENPIPLPEGLVNGEIQRRLEEMVRGMMMRGIDPRTVDVDWDELRNQQAEPSRKAVHARLVLDAIAASESLAVDAVAVEARVRQEARRLGEEPRELRDRLLKSGGLELLKNQMVREKSLDFLTSVANIHREG